jgi:hypothetical protein
LTRRTRIVFASSRNLLTRCMVARLAITPAITHTRESSRVATSNHDACVTGSDQILENSQGRACIAGLLDRGFLTFRPSSLAMSRGLLKFSGGSLVTRAPFLVGRPFSEIATS